MAYKNAQLRDGAVWCLGNGHSHPKGTWYKVPTYSVANGYVGLWLDSKLLLLHRVIWELEVGPIPEGMQIDHINGIRHDNGINNLRLVTPKGNGCNQTRHRAGYLIGTSFKKSHGLRASQIRYKGRTKFLGYYKSMQEAHARYLQELQMIGDSNGMGN